MSESSTPATRLSEDHPEFWAELKRLTRLCEDVEEMLALSALRRQSSAKGAPELTRQLRIAILGGDLPSRLGDLLEHLLWSEGVESRPLIVAGQDPVAQILEPESDLYAQHPDWVVLF